MQAEVDNRKLLIAIIGITLVTLPVAAFTSGALRIALGIPFVLFFPGYTLVSALFPKQNDLSVIERIALSFGLSIAVVPLIGLILNYTPWGIRLYPILVSLLLFILITAAIAHYRQIKLPTSERLSYQLSFHLPSWQRMGRVDRVLTISAALAICAAIGSLAYVIATPKAGERFTEFYILGPEGKAENYPKKVISGEPVHLIVGVVNHEQRTVDYRVEITIQGEKVAELAIGSLQHEQKWEQAVSFVPNMPGEKQKVEFYLYLDDETEPYFQDPLHLYLDVATEEPELPAEESANESGQGSDNLTISQ